MIGRYSGSGSRLNTGSNKLRCRRQSALTGRQPVTQQHTQHVGLGLTLSVDHEHVGDVVRMPDKTCRSADVLAISHVTNVAESVRKTAYPVPSSRQETEKLVTLWRRRQLARDL